MKIDFSTATWIFEPKQSVITDKKIQITTEPVTDFWQRSYYGFRNDNAPSLLVENQDNFTFTVKVSFDYQNTYDQCGVIIYLNSENWFKASIEYETPEYSRLGSVVTNLGYSDWENECSELIKCKGVRFDRFKCVGEFYAPKVCTREYVFINREDRLTIDGRRNDKIDCIAGI